MDIEKPADDAQEQDRELVEGGDEEEVTPQRPAGSVPFDANEADAAEQDRTVGDSDEEDYR